MPYLERVEWLKVLNETHSKTFCSTDAQIERRLYRARYKTRIFAFQCMDGRIHIPCATETPPGIIKSFRNLGGKFSLGWYNLDSAFSEEVGHAIKNGQQSLVIATYHFSKSSKHKGCAGFNYNKKEAIAKTIALKEQIERVYGFNNKVVCPIVCGFETDEDSLVLHGDSGKTLDLSTVNSSEEAELIMLLRKLYKKMPDSILHDFLPLVQGNIRHIAEIRKKGGPIKEVEHREDILAIGRGFDWLYQPNLALIIGPYQIDIAEPIKKAAGIIQLNMREGRISDKGFILLTSAVHRSGAGTEIARAKERAIELSNFSQKIIRQCCRSIAGKMHPLTVVTSLDTRRFKEIKQY